VNGLRLASMPASDMLDVLHYFFEDDLATSSSEQTEARSKVREAVYRDLYDVKYKYGINNGSSYDAEGHQNYNIEEESSDTEVVPFDPLKKPTKGYVPPTQFNPAAVNPFQGVLDAPAGH